MVKEPKRLWIPAAASVPPCAVGGVVHAHGYSLRKETKPPLVFTWLTGEVQKRSLPIGRAARYSRRSSVSEGPSL